jgi:FGGY-family pentulose kinase
MPPVKKYVLGVDVGTLSTRAGVFDLKGTLLGSAHKPISIYHPRPDFVEQSSDEIWEKTGMAIREALRQAQITKQEVLGLCFDATCSLAALDKKGGPVTISPTGEASRNILVWMDHRAIEEAELINDTRHPALRFVGGRISPEQQPPKLKWIKRHLPRTWKLAGKFMDLADFMVFKATGEDKRSLCTSVCKWTYQGHKGETGAWDYSFFARIGLSDLFEDEKVPPVAHPLGRLAGRLKEEEARSLGLSPGTAVGVGIIDAHAGGIGVLGHCAREASKDRNAWNKALALIGGTSSCHMAVSPGPRYIRGIWGPYYSAMIPGLWLNEGGQSATGSLIDYTIKNNSSYEEIESCAKRAGMDVYQFLNYEIMKKPGPELTKDVHVLPYHHGNRSPRADSLARGVVVGLTLDQSLSEVVKHYYATVQAIAYGTRHILEAMNKKGFCISDIYLCGGHTKNDIFLQEHADITGCRIHLPREKEAVLLGTATLAAVAAGTYPSIIDAMTAMSKVSQVIKPNTRHRAYHERKYKIFKLMYEQFKVIRRSSQTG